jgi:hypothetical protein
MVIRSLATIEKKYYLPVQVLNPKIYSCIIVGTITFTTRLQRVMFGLRLGIQIRQKFCSDHKSGLYLNFQDFVRIKSCIGTFFSQKSFRWRSGPATYYRGSLSIVYHRYQLLQLGYLVEFKIVQQFSVQGIMCSGSQIQWLLRGWAAAGELFVSLFQDIYH